MCRGVRGKHLWYSGTFSVPTTVVRDWCVACGERGIVEDINDWTFSMHALDRALDMAVDPEDLRLTLTRPDWTRASPPTRPEYQGCRIHIRGKLAVAVDPAMKRVITVMWYKQFKTGSTKRIENVLQEEEFFRDDN